MSATMWEKHKVERREESKEKKMSSYSREKKNCKIDNKKDWRREKKVEADHRKI